MFLKSDSSYSSTYQYGIVENVHLSKDGKIRKVDIRYRNSNETTNRFTTRAVRQLVIVHHVNEINIMTELNNMVHQLSSFGYD